LLLLLLLLQFNALLLEDAGCRSPDNSAAARMTLNGSCDDITVPL
jgi:hypothetical protein